MLIIMCVLSIIAILAISRVMTKDEKEQELPIIRHSNTSLAQRLPSRPLEAPKGTPWYMKELKK